MARAPKKKRKSKTAGTRSTRATSAHPIEMPRADDFRLLDDLDEFNKHVKAAVAHLLERGYHRLFIKWMLKQHQSYAGAQVLSNHSTLVDLVTMQVDERTSGTRRRDLIDALVAADALDGEGGNEKRHKRLRDRLSNTRKWKRERDIRLGRHEPAPEGDAGFEDPEYIDFMIWSVIDDLHGVGVGAQSRNACALSARSVSLKAFASRASKKSTKPSLRI